MRAFVTLCIPVVLAFTCKYTAFETDYYTCDHCLMSNYFLLVLAANAIIINKREISAPVKELIGLMNDIETKFNALNSTVSLSHYQKKKKKSSTCILKTRIK